MADRTVDPRTPVIAGVGQVNASYPAAEPALLLAEALTLAAPPSVLNQLDSLEVVAIGTRPYSNPGSLVAKSLGIPVPHLTYTTHGGHSPQSLLNRAAWNVWQGRRSIVAIGGAESWRTRRLLRREGKSTGWTVQDISDQPDETFGAELSMATAWEAALGFGDPLDAYPMLESALRQESGRSLPSHDRVVAQLWSTFTEVAAANPFAARKRVMTANDMMSPANGNRRISHPYRKVEVSNNDVDQAAAVIVTSIERATSLGFSKHDLIFIHGFGEAADCDSFTARISYTRSAAIAQAAATALAMAEVSIEDIELFDIYSCFPSAVQIAARELGLPLGRHLTVTGGLTFAGGPWNNYVTHSIATMVTELRERTDTLGMCTANGGLLTKHAIGIYGARPPAGQISAPLVHRCDDRRPVLEQWSGAVTLLATTVRYSREDVATHGFAVAKTHSSQQILLRVEDATLLHALESRECVGLEGTASGTLLVDLRIS